MCDAIIGAGGTIIGSLGVITALVQGKRRAFKVDNLNFRITKLIEEKERLKNSIDDVHANNRKKQAVIESLRRNAITNNNARNELQRRLDNLYGTCSDKTAEIFRLNSVIEQLADPKQYRVRRCHNGLLGANLTQQEIFDLFS